ncbi:hypothetical protein COW36_05155 [bacterium (Candidatus Blackallbacteria) CG17_big_fil_post_rev_8_21_14_2_50_48_46]|uniref:Uncharacterized protein n=1 Tax=bacterium (Candidatus Blackallbacteria) CG17_big_fil_post_rev_8_21_14_2_50_48_46 TaxID=2014261 RepID=A0A2M7G9B0_9BACT|nr:MAG: hypothetical protein COW64_03790 [bacterium (Candidatus Blackallbacteria) CG18_big_fil_WC_8_21_14_2_50_49_26]PIW18685.1 MAG: hypothetical protein COW36_05155 [bacterium (Candidatus Blackallbacteria) CG17_big_fil_post_rev_8_21_14_2_50_48_46]PIW46329.1 MAG: hypothetical protein COW20_15525 [bacterium (Candidatus Blackallbacteria) CG13_big_fil_rev_8_21_14_2_50_49_14]
MSYIYRCISIFTIALFLIGAKPAPDQSYTINKIIGDISFLERYGQLPTLKTNTNLRIQTHLAYVEERLRKVPNTHISPHLRLQRETLLDHLKTYRLAQKFPRNYEYQNQSRPVFIDREGNICAVGYLIEKTAGRKLAQILDLHYHNAYLKDMKLPALSTWVKNSGFSLEELAMIQPSYPSTPLPESPPDLNIVIPSLGLDALSVTWLLTSSLPIQEPDLYSGIKISGMVIGGATVGWGLLNFGDNQGYSSLKTRLSLANISIGLATILINWYQLQNPPQANDPLVLGQFPAYAQQEAIGLSYKYKY